MALHQWQCAEHVEMIRQRIGEVTKVPGVRAIATSQPTGHAGISPSLFATDAATFRGRYIITTFVPNAGGIRRGDPVQMRGVNIGRVTDFQMVPDGVAVVAP